MNDIETIGYGDFRTSIIAALAAAVRHESEDKE